MCRLIKELENAERRMTACSSWKLLPEPNRDALKDYVLYGTPVTGFLKEVVCDSLVGAATYADSYNIACLHCWAIVMRHGVPMSCRGSVKVMENWVNKGGLQGIINKLEQEKDNGDS